MKKLLMLAGMAGGLSLANLDSDAVVVLRPVSGSTMICSNITYWGAAGGATGLSNNFAGVWQAMGDTTPVVVTGDRVALTNSQNVVGWGTWDGETKTWSPGGTSNDNWWVYVAPRAGFYLTNGSAPFTAYISMDIIRANGTTSSFYVGGCAFSAAAGGYVNGGDVIPLAGDEKLGVVFSGDSDVCAAGARFSLFKVAGP